MIEIGLFFGLLLALLLGAGVWIGIAMLTLGMLGIALFTSAPVIAASGTSVWGSMASWTLAALPLFIWMGEILYRTRTAENMFKGLAPWVGQLPGGLLHVGVLGSAVFAAVCGSSTATSATVGRITLPELRRRGYDDRMALGSLAGAGTLGLLIPPSIIMIVYGAAAEVSIVRLFIAGVIPGLLLAGLFSGYIALWALRHPEHTPPEPKYPLSQKIKASGQLLPVVLLIILVISSIYFGVATATEAAALGVVGALGVAWWSGTLTVRSFTESLKGATRLSCMITLIVAGAACLTSAMAYTGIPIAIAGAIAHAQLSPYVMLALLSAIYIVLGMFLDGISMIVLTTAVVLPAIQAAGFDLIWFGVYIVILVEMAAITPPVGFNLFVLQALGQRSLSQVVRSAFPFFFVMLLMLVITATFPAIATWLPSRMFSG